MPEMNGLGLLERIKEDHEDQKVYMISAAGEDDFKNDAQNKGADGYFTKPIDFENLKAFPALLSGRLARGSLFLPFLIPYIVTP